VLRPYEVAASELHGRREVKGYVLGLAVGALGLLGDYFVGDFVVRSLGARIFFAN